MLKYSELGWPAVYPFGTSPIQVRLTRYEHIAGLLFQECVYPLRFFLNINATELLCKLKHQKSLACKLCKIEMWTCLCFIPHHLHFLPAFKQPKLAAIWRFPSQCLPLTSGPAVLMPLHPQGGGGSVESLNCTDFWQLCPLSSLIGHSTFSKICLKVRT